MDETQKYLETSVLSTRIRLARNIDGYPFPSLLTKSQAKEISSLVGKALSALDEFNRYDMSEIPEADATYLKEKHLISEDLIRNKAYSTAFIYANPDEPNEKISVMVNEEDHLREQYIIKGFDLYKAYDRLNALDDGLEAEIPFAFDEKLGYLTACPSNLGTGMRASVMMFLPGLSTYGSIKNLTSGLKKNGFTVRGVFGEGSYAEGDIYQISNERTLGVSETDILSNMEKITLNLTVAEAKERERLVKDEGIKLKDKCLRAFGLLTNCAFLSAEELEENGYYVRLGVSLGYFKATDMNAFNDFVENMRPHSFKRKNFQSGDENACNILRADIVGRTLKNLIVR